MQFPIRPSAAGFDSGCVVRIESHVSCSDLVRSSSPSVAGLLFESAGYLRDRPFHLDDEHLSPKVSESLRSNLNCIEAQPRDIHYFKFGPAIIVGQGTVILHGGRLLVDSCAEFLAMGITPDGMKECRGDMVYPDPSRTLDGRALLIKRPWYRNFGHFLVDLMPVMSAMGEQGIKFDHLLFGDVQNGELRNIMMRLAARLFPDAAVHLVSDVEAMHLSELYYCEPVHIPALFKHPLAMMAARQTAVDEFSGRSEASRARRIYVSRKQARNKRVKNEDELESALAGHGFTIFHPEAHTFAEQISAFQNAEVLIGPKGAAFSNLLFCEPSAHLLLLSSEEFIDPFFWDLSAVRRVRYSEIFCKPAGVDGAAKVDIVVDIGKVEAYLAMI